MLVTNDFLLLLLMMLINVFKTNLERTPIVISLYVDDMWIFGTNLKVIYKTKKFLESNFDIKDLKEA